MAYGVGEGPGLAGTSGFGRVGSGAEICAPGPSSRTSGMGSGTVPEFVSASLPMTLPFRLDTTFRKPSPKAKPSTEPPEVVHDHRRKCQPGSLGTKDLGPQRHRLRSGVDQRTDL